MSGSAIEPGTALDLVDSDGAVRETRERASRSSRGAFVGGLVGTVLAAGAPAAAALSRNDVDILNYALSLEYLQSSFYTEAERRGALRGDARRTARVLGSVERAHVKALRAVLGRAAIGRPFFDFRGTTENEDAFIRTAVAFEDLGTAAYKDQAPLIDSPKLLAAAISIHTVEARHAAWIRYLAGAKPAGEAIDEPISRSKALAIVRNTGFVVSRPRTAGSGAPRYTG